MGPDRVRGEGLSGLSPSVNMHAITSAAVIYITHKSHEPIKYGFGGTKICSGGRQKIFNVGKTLPLLNGIFGRNTDRTFKVFHT